MIYHGKRGVRKNLSKAFKYFQEAASDIARTDADSAYNLALMKMKGQGSAVDVKGAVEVQSSKSLHFTSLHFKILREFFTSIYFNFRKSDYFSLHFILLYFTEEKISLHFTLK